MLNDSIHDELIDLAFAVCDGTAVDAQVDRIEELIAGDPKSRLLYLQCLELHFEMQHRMGNEGSEVSGQEVAGDQWPVASVTNHKSKIINQKSPALAPNPCPTIILDTSSPLPSPLAPLPYHVAHPFLFSNMISLLIVGIGLLGAWVYQVDIPHPIAATQHNTKTTDPSPATPSESCIGQITSMVDCNWEKDCKFKLFSSKTDNRNPKFPISLGDKFVLSSGLLEITYDTGAKVILEGPVTYEVESAAGGYLSVGKLTARLEKRGEGRGESMGKRAVVSGQWPVASETNPKSQITKSQISNPQSLIPNPFTIHTPTATITDLGTEFGVEVDRHGNVLCAVLQGEVQFSRLAGSDEKQPAVMHLKQGQAARAGHTEAGIATAAFKPDTFVRVIRHRAVAGKQSQSLITTAFVKPSWWRYSTERPNGDYTQPKFDDSYWTMSKAGFGGGSFHSGPNGTGERIASPPIVTGWGEPDIWLRQEIVVPATTEFHKAVLTLFSYGSVEIHLNGKPIFSRSQAHPGYAAFEVTDALRAAIQPGVNVVAVHAVRTAKSGAYIDLGLTLDPTDAGLPDSPISPDRLKGEALVLATTADDMPTDWHWTTDRPSGNWTGLDFNHNAWAEGKSGFGNTAEMVPHISRGMIGTNWNEPDIWIRKEIEIDKLPDRCLALLRIYHDEDVEVYVNGKPVFVEPGFLTEWKAVDITDQLRGVLRPGRNVLAIHVHQTVGGQYIDAGLTLYSQ